MNTISSTLSATQTYAQDFISRLKIDQETINKASKIAMDVIQSIGAAIGAAAVAVANIYTNLDPKTTNTLLGIGGFTLLVFVLSRSAEGKKGYPVVYDGWAQKMARDDRESEAYISQKTEEKEKIKALAADSTSMHGGDDSKFVKVGTRR
ncbi:MAG: hypothetical protein JSS09_07920 [Verrucomicrobia bacterium]|nr:hypothetical protein [Verrucomicrobiota bacterium]